MKQLTLLTISLLFLISCSNNSEKVNIEFVEIIKKAETVNFLMGATEDELNRQPHRQNDPNYYYSDESALKVILDRAYQIRKYEITNQQFADVMYIGLESGQILIKNGDLYDPFGRQLLGIKHFSEDKYLGVQFGLEIQKEELKIIESKENWAAHAVTWIGAITYCNLLSQINGFEPVYDLQDMSWDHSKNGYRLPTEAEWEYAARADKRYTYA